EAVAGRGDLPGGSLSVPQGGHRSFQFGALDLLAAGGLGAERRPLPRCFGLLHRLWRGLGLWRPHRRCLRHDAR
ncbi:unnamed protein product, partial [Durusdinium trenchii]